MLFGDYGAIYTAALDAPLDTGVTYAVSFWIHARPSERGGYRYRLTVLPDVWPQYPNNAERLYPDVRSENIIAEVNAPWLDVSAPRSTDRHHERFTFTADRPYNTITVALRGYRSYDSPIDPERDITVSGFFIAPLIEPSEDDALTAVPAALSLDTDETALTTVTATAAPSPPKPPRTRLPPAATFRLSGPSARLGIYDHKRVDGDSVSVLLNDALLIDAHALGREVHWVPLSLKPGTNRIVLHAENLGARPPNTCAFYVEAGGERRRIVLNSDLEESSGFVVEWAPE